MAISLQFNLWRWQHIFKSKIIYIRFVFIPIVILPRYFVNYIFLEQRKRSQKSYVFDVFSKLPPVMRNNPTCRKGLMTDLPGLGMEYIPSCANHHNWDLSLMSPLRFMFVENSYKPNSKNNKRNYSSDMHMYNVVYYVNEHIPDVFFTCYC